MDIITLCVHADESLIKEDLEQEGFTPDWKIISNAIADAEIAIDKAVGKMLNGVAITEYHDDNYFYADFGSMGSSVKANTFIMNVSRDCLDRFEDGNVTIFSMETVGDLIDNEWGRILSHIDKKYGEMAMIAVATLEVSIEFTDNDSMNNDL